MKTNKEIAFELVNDYKKSGQLSWTPLIEMIEKALNEKEEKTETKDGA